MINAGHSFYIKTDFKVPFENVEIPAGSLALQKLSLLTDVGEFVIIRNPRILGGDFLEFWVSKNVVPATPPDGGKFNLIQPIGLTGIQRQQLFTIAGLS